VSHCLCPEFQRHEATDESGGALQFIQNSGLGNAEDDEAHAKAQRHEEENMAWFKLRWQSRTCQEAEFITKYPETRFLTGAALLPNAHRIEPCRFWN